MKKTICILGGSGFVGKHLASELARQGHTLRILTRHPERHRPMQVLPGIQLIAANIFDPGQLLQHFSGCDVVINLVGILNEPRDNGKGFERVHVQLVDEVVKACEQAGVRRLLHMSALNADADNAPSYYLRSKGRGEDRAHASTQLNTTSFRPSVIFGPGDSFINRFAGLLRFTPVLPLACGRSRFTPVYVGDVARAFTHSLGDPASYGQRYDLCGPNTYSLTEIVQYIARTTGRLRYIMPLGKYASALQANLLQYVPGKPFSRDNFRSLQVDSVCSQGNALTEVFHLRPVALEAVVPAYLLGQTYRSHYNDLRRH